MKKSFLPHVLMGMALSLPSCLIIKEKDDDKVKPHKTKCTIEEVRFIADSTYYASSGTYDRTLYFNNKGEPTKLAVDNPSTGNAPQLFVYNNKGWFTQWIYYFGNSPSDLDAPVQVNNIFTAHLYEHDAKGNIVKDSFFISMGTPIHSHYYKGNTTTYTYDYKGRIIATRLHDEWTPGSVTKEYYYYNTVGNLETVATYDSSSFGEMLRGNSYYTYDNKPSVIATSKTLMFLNRNYSKNNTLSVSSDPNVYPLSETYTVQYNAQGLLVKKSQTLSPVEGYSIGTSFVKYNYK